jgi:hypothetical protein
MRETREPHKVFVAYPPSRRLNTKVRVFVDRVKVLFASMDERSDSASESRT